MIDRLQCQYFRIRLATVDASKLQEASKRVRRVNNTSQNPARTASPPGADRTLDGKQRVQD